MEKNLLAIVVIGRNEGPRLRACFDSLSPFVSRLLYVDSGSTDGSVALAKERGIAVLELTSELPFSAARARNEGALAAGRAWPDCAFVQFVDGDCRIDGQWLESGLSLMSEKSQLGLLTGVQAELHPDRSVYSMLFAAEWQQPPGPLSTCTGNVMVRLAAFQAANGYDASLIAGEDPDLCQRLTAAGWQCLRVDKPMALHDSGNVDFKAWFKRTVRSGFAYAALAERRSEDGGPREIRHLVSNVIYGALLPPLVLVAIVSGALSGALLLTAPYVVLILRVTRHGRARGLAPRPAFWNGVFTAIGKFPECLGQLQHLTKRWHGQTATLIEYKDD